VNAYPKKGKGTMKKKEEKAERPIIISYRRRCVSDVTGTGLSHYIMFEDEE
jgi:modified peptide precursor CbpA